MAKPEWARYMVPSSEIPQGLDSAFTPIETVFQRLEESPARVVWPHKPSSSNYTACFLALLSDLQRRYACEPVLFPAAHPTDPWYTRLVNWALPNTTTCAPPLEELREGLVRAGALKEWPYDKAVSSALSVSLPYVNKPNLQELVDPLLEFVAMARQGTIIQDKCDFILAGPDRYHLFLAVRAAALAHGVHSTLVPEVICVRGANVAERNPTGELMAYVHLTPEYSSAISKNKRRWMAYANGTAKEFVVLAMEEARDVAHLTALAAPPGSPSWTPRGDADSSLDFGRRCNDLASELTTFYQSIFGKFKTGAVKSIRPRLSRMDDFARPIHIDDARKRWIVANVLRPTGATYAGGNKLRAIDILLLLLREEGWMTSTAIKSSFSPGSAKRVGDLLKALTDAGFLEKQYQRGNGPARYRFYNTAFTVGFNRQVLEDAASATPDHLDE